MPDITIDQIEAFAAANPSVKVWTEITLRSKKGSTLFGEAEAAEVKVFIEQPSVGGNIQRQVGPYAVSAVKEGSEIGKLIGKATLQAQQAVATLADDKAALETQVKEKADAQAQAESLCAQREQELADAQKEIERLTELAKKQAADSKAAAPAAPAKPKA